MNANKREKESSQIPAMELLKSLGYKEVSKEESDLMRGNKHNVILKDILRKNLMELNSFEYKGVKCKFSLKNIEQAIEDIDEPLVDGLIKTNEKIYDSLMIGRSYQEKIEGDKILSFDLNYIDWDEPLNNEFHFVSEFVVERENGNDYLTPDIVLFVNGIPFAVIENKDASVHVEEGISQMIRNQNKENIPNLFKFAQIVASTNTGKLMYATCGTEKKFWAIWEEEFEDWQQEILSRVVTGRRPTAQDMGMVSLFHPERLLELTRYFVIYDRQDKKIARYQQYFAIKAIIKRIQNYDDDGRRSGGIVWHTQGSGKSLTMVMLAKYILSEMKDISPRVLVITDRVNLDKQIRATFAHTRLKPSRATTGKHLMELIESDSVDIITTLVNKFKTVSELTDSIDGSNIFMLVDESHRTQLTTNILDETLYKKMYKVFPKACYLGFTGTPLRRKEKEQYERFGDYVHKYTIADGVRDKAIVPLLYEGKYINQEVNQKAIDTRLDMISRNLTKKQIEEMKVRWSRFEKIASSEQRLALIAFDVNQHFMENYKKHGSCFKGMLVANSRLEAVRYQKYFEEVGEVNTAVVISRDDKRDGYSKVDEDNLDEMKQFWKEIDSKHGNEEKYEEYVKDEFVYGDNIDILIVNNKLLTGFDAPRATVLYVDKPMKEHTLLQAIARANRLYEGKDYGFIIDYRGLVDKLDEAMNMYSGSGLDDFNPEEIKNAMYDVISIIATLRYYHTQLINRFIRICNKDDFEEYEVLLGNKELRNEFYSDLSQFSRHLGIAIESEEVCNSIGDDELEKYKSSFTFYQKIRKNLKVRYSEGLDFQEYKAKMQKLMDTYITANEVFEVTAPVDILNKEQFLIEIDRLPTKRGKADAIRTRLTERVSIKYKENPSYYRKFSQMIEETIQNYKDGRVNDTEYLNRMKDILDKFWSGASGIQYPSNLINKPHAQAFYGEIKPTLEKENDLRGKEEEIGEMSIEIKLIIDTHAKVDFKTNVEVHKAISRDMYKLLYGFTKKYSITLSVKDMNKIIDDVKGVAINRY